MCNGSLWRLIHTIEYLPVQGWAHYVAGPTNAPRRKWWLLIPLTTAAIVNLGGGGAFRGPWNPKVVWALNLPKLLILKALMENLGEYTKRDILSVKLQKNISKKNCFYKLNEVFLSLFQKSQKKISLYFPSIFPFTETAYVGTICTYVMSM